MTKLFDMLPGWVWALIVAGFAMHSCGQSNKIDAGKIALAKQETATSKAEGETKQAEKDLSDRVAAEAQTVAKAVIAARAEELDKFKKLQEKTNVLRKENETARADLAAANERLRDPIATAATGYGCPDLSKPGAAAGGADASPQAQFERAGRALTDEILHLFTEADEAIRERALLQQTHPGMPKP